MTNAEVLARLLDGPGPLLLDFDGPVCGVFAGLSAADVAADLVALLDSRGVDVPPDVKAETDPLQVLQWTAGLGKRAITRAVEDALCVAELHAVRLASPTAYARECIVAAHQIDKPVGIVSNNSANAILGYLDEHRLSPHISAVVGRAYAEPERMKPHPAPLLQAAGALRAAPETCVLVGDSVTDVAAGHAASVPVVGYANKPPKVAKLGAAGADVVITSMRELASALLDQADQ